ncbi:hypothetical protein RIF29_14992 [Crotalaria pallida]|uniref:Myb/SANT-like domain-containing protein n=1 Tax=Crotalaria pallida TaxID=3830 RepID=A0AAN9IE94_CROPI
MASTNVDVEGKTYNWSVKRTTILLELCLEFIVKNGRTQNFKWNDIQKDFEARTNSRVSNCRSWKNKYDQMKNDWRLWKTLKQSETGLGWDPSTGKLDCSKDWWDRKIKEKSEVRKFRNKGVPPANEELWDHLYGDVVANGSECVAPSIDPDVQYRNTEEFQGNDEENETNNEERFGEQENFGDQAFSIYKQYSSRMESQERDNGGYWFDFTDEGYTDNTQENNHDHGATNTKWWDYEIYRTTKACYKAQALESDCKTPNNVNNTQTSGSSIVMVMNILNHMDGLETGSTLWCYAIDLLEDATKRDFFIQMADDTYRLAWINFKYDRASK